MNFKLLYAHIILLINVYLIVASQDENNEKKINGLNGSFKTANRLNRKLDQNNKNKVSSSTNDDEYFSSFISNKHKYAQSNRNFNNRRFNSFNADSSFTSLNSECPPECACSGLSIDCSYRELKQVPKNIPKNVIKV